jgi:hypothetical protein
VKRRLFLAAASSAPAIARARPRIGYLSGRSPRADEVIE